MESSDWNTASQFDEVTSDDRDESFDDEHSATGGRRGDDASIARWSDHSVTSLTDRSQTTGTPDRRIYRRSGLSGPSHVLVSVPNRSHRTRHPYPLSCLFRSCRFYAEPEGNDGRFGRTGAHLTAAEKGAASRDDEQVAGHRR